jgi:hypothetical protein
LLLVVAVVDKLDRATLVMPLAAVAVVDFVQMFLVQPLVAVRLRKPL